MPFVDGNESHWLDWIRARYALADIIAIQSIFINSTSINEALQDAVDKINEDLEYRLRVFGVTTGP